MYSGLFRYSSTFHKTSPQLPTHLHLLQDHGQGQLNLRRWSREGHHLFRSVPLPQDHILHVDLLKHVERWWAMWYTQELIIISHPITTNKELHITIIHYYYVTGWCHPQTALSIGPLWCVRTDSVNLPWSPKRCGNNQGSCCWVWELSSYGTPSLHARSLPQGFHILTTSDSQRLVLEKSEMSGHIRTINDSMYGIWPSKIKCCNACVWLWWSDWFELNSCIMACILCHGFYVMDGG